MQIIKNYSVWLMLIGILCLSHEQLQADSSRGYLYALHKQQLQVRTDLDSVIEENKRIDFLSQSLDSPYLHDEDIFLTARMTSGWSNAKLKQLIDRAHALSQDDGFDGITMRHVQAAWNRMELGFKISDMRLCHNNIEEVAVHEAGHIVSFVHNNCGATILHEATIMCRSGGFAGSVNMLQAHHGNLTIKDFENEIISAWSGGVADQIFGRYWQFPQEMLTDDNQILQLSLSRHLLQDMNIAREYARWIVTSHNQSLNADQIQTGMNRIIINLYKQAYRFIAAHTDEVAHIAELFMQQHTLPGDEIYDELGMYKPLYDFQEGRPVSA